MPVARFTSFRLAATALLAAGMLLAIPGGALANGRSIIHLGDVGSERFLEDGGSIRSRNTVLTPYGRIIRPAPKLDGFDDDFLRDGGSIDPAFPRRKIERLRRGAFSSRSVQHLRRPFHGSGSSFQRGTGIYANANPGGVWVAPAPDDRFLDEAEPFLDGGGPKLIDVASARLDRQPIGPSGISVHYSGSAKIIRIAPDYDMNRAARAEPPAPVAEDRPVAALGPQPYRPPVSSGSAPEISAPDPARVPVPSPAPAMDEATTEPAPSVAAEPPAEGLEPWTDEWLRDCVARYENFDASLGTYTDETGRRRFCTGDPA